MSNLAVWRPFWIILLMFSKVYDAFYVPGVAPNDINVGAHIDVKAVKMTSVHTQLPYEYYSLPFCLPKNGTFAYKSENLGEVLRGDRIVNTPYEVNMAENVSCRLLCHSRNNPINWNEEESQRVISRIEHEYDVHLLVDNLPCATKEVNLVTKEIKYRPGYPLGFMSQNEDGTRSAYINNHLKLILDYHSHTKGTYRVVGFEVAAQSVGADHLKFDGDVCHFSEGAPGQQVNPVGGTKLFFTYSVHWRQSDVSWASRWDIYLKMSDVKIKVHWFSIINSLMVAVLLTGMITVIIVRVLRRDIARYNTAIEEAIEETGWKLVHGDVFRPPKHPRLFVAVIGSGIQLFFMAFIIMILATLGMLSPSSRGALMTAGIFLYVFMGLIGGYYSARLYKTLKGREWKRAAFLTATIYPAIVSGICFFLNFFIWGKHSSGAVPFVTMLSLFSLWLCVSLPLVYLGYYFGYRKQAFQHPVRTNQIPRQVPDQPWFMNPVLCTLMAGVLPFTTVFIELFYIFTAIWENQFYYMFGFLFLVFLILVVTVSQIATVMLYFQLLVENYHWWWRTLFISGGIAFYVLCYAVYYFFTKLEITEFIPVLLYFGYTTIMVITFWLMTSTVGFFAAYYFVRKIYGAVKVD